MRGNSSKSGNINLKTFEVLRHIRNDILKYLHLKDKCYHPLAFLHVVGLDFCHMITLYFLQHQYLPRDDMSLRHSNLKNNLGSITDIDH
jgi:hypothetical protein